MSSHVFVQVTTLTTLKITELTFKWFHTTMSSCMSLQMTNPSRQIFTYNFHLDALPPV